MQDPPTYSHIMFLQMKESEEDKSREVMLFSFDASRKERATVDSRLIAVVRIIEFLQLEPFCFLKWRDHGEIDNVFSFKLGFGLGLV